MARRVPALPLTRVLIASALFYGLWQAGDPASAALLGRPASPIQDRVIIAIAALWGVSLTTLAVLLVVWFHGLTSEVRLTEESIP